MNNNQRKKFLYRDLNGNDYYTINNGIITPHKVFKATCSNGINKLTFYESGDQTEYVNDDNILYERGNQTVYEQTCNNDISNGPMNDITVTKLTYLDIDCKNHPITYVNLNGKLQYSCGYNSTGSGIVTGNISVGSSNTIDCGDKVLTSLKYKNVNGPVIEYTCKNVYPNVTSDTSVYKSEIFNTTKSNYIKGFNISTNSFNNPSVYWSKHDYTDIIPSDTDEEHTAPKTINNDFFGVSCGKYGITGIRNSGDKIKYGCGTDELYDLHVQSYELPYDPVLNKYYDNGLLFDKVKCDKNEVLSGFHKTITPIGPAIKWVCGKLI